MTLETDYRIRYRNAWQQHWPLLASVLLGFGLRMFQLGGQSLWYDETVSAYLAGLLPAELVLHTTRDIHPPGYYLLLHFWLRLVGNSELALAYFSLLFGLLLIPLTAALARQLTHHAVAKWTALLVAISPFHIWYAQEVRMYTLGTVLGVIAVLCLVWAFRSDSPLAARPFLLGYLVVAALGLYVLYYFAFLLIAVNLFFLGIALYPVVSQWRLKSLVAANSLVLVLFLPWLPFAWRQAANPPVPPWRSPPALLTVLIESWSALSLGQSVEPVLLWPVLLVTVILFGIGIWYLALFPDTNQKSPALANRLEILGLLLSYIFGPVLIIYLLSFITPLYHVRYIFTYSPPFYVVLAAAFVGLATRFRWWIAGVAFVFLAGASLFSLYQYHTNPRYQADDFRAAVRFIEQQRQPGDVMLVNAGYVYPAYIYYANEVPLQRDRLVPYSSSDAYPRLLQSGTVEGSPQLGWGDIQSDFFAMSWADTEVALAQMRRQYARLWLLRAYDTVTDPDAMIRSWLAEHAIPIEDQLFAGPSNIRVQGFLLAKPPPDVAQDGVMFEDNMVLGAWQLPAQPWQAGDQLPVKLWWSTTSRPSSDYKMSLKLWMANGQLAAQGQDAWPGGSLYRASRWRAGELVYQPANLNLPADLSPGQYWLNVELYNPDTIQPLPRLDSGETAVTLGSIQIE